MISPLLNTNSWVFTLIPKLFRHVYTAFLCVIHCLYHIGERLILFLTISYPSTTYFTELVSSDDEFWSDLFEKDKRCTKFMKKYTAEQMTALIQNSPMGRQLEKIGFGDWFIELDLSDPFNHYLYIRSPQYPSKSDYIAFMIIRTDIFHIKTSAHSKEGLDYLRQYFNKSDVRFFNIKWLSLQNPAASFTKDRPRLPGQRYPGSGIGRTFLTELRKLSLNNSDDGIVNIPEHFHNAFMYQGFYFLDPINQGIFNKMIKDLKVDIREKGLGNVSWAVGVGALKLDGKPYPWNPGEFVCPLSNRMIAYFDSFHYTNAVSICMKNTGLFTIDWQILNNIVEIE